MKLKSFFTTITLSLSLMAAANAANIALNKPVIEVSSTYPSFAGFNFSGSKVTDGSTSDSFGNNYWITKDGEGLGATITIDLQNVYSITEIGLRNTNNTQHNDRGTGNFRLLASNSVNESAQLVSAQTILTGTLAQGSNTLALFTPSNGLVAGDYRYLQFVVDSLAPWATNTRSAGLNEIEVQGTLAPVPEPSAALLGTLGLLGILSRRSRYNGNAQQAAV